MNYNIFVINLKRCVEKRKNMENRLKWLNFTIVDACDGKNLSISELRKIHEKIWEIIQEIEFESEDDNDENKDIEYLRNIMKKVIDERVERQREEVGRSPE